MTHTNRIAAALNLPNRKVENTIALLEEGATIPFISRYRKEATGSLDEVQIGDIASELKKLQELEKRKETILKTIQDQGKLSDDLKKRIEGCWDSVELEDIYLPYKPKRMTRATKARAKGLQPLAEFIFQQNNNNVEAKAADFINEEVENVEEALKGARDIIAEMIAENEISRNKVRYAFKKGADINAKVARGKEEEGAKYKDYFKFAEPLKRCPSHRLLAMFRGEGEGFLRISVAPESEEVLYRLEQEFIENRGEASQQVKTALHDSYDRLLQPSIETEFRRAAKELADAEAIKVFVENLRQLLLSAPLGQRRTLGIDPGFRTGCKVVVLNENGDLLHNTTIYPHPPQSRGYESESKINDLVEKYQIAAIAVGNGTAGRETIDLCRKLKFKDRVEVFQVNEAGASIYSASAVAREEFPDYDVTVRGAVSIGRRLMDPLAELVKIDPKSIGVGQYQHDVNQTKLKDSLDRTVESCVNSVGINLNTASKHLLTYVSGLGPTLANNIVKYRSENGEFNSRKQLKKVPRMGDKAFEQCAGFLRIRNAKQLLDNTAVHPESYHIVEKMATDLNVGIADLIDDQEMRNQINLKNYVSDKNRFAHLE